MSYSQARQSLQSAIASLAQLQTCTDEELRGVQSLIEFADNHLDDAVQQIECEREENDREGQ